MLCAGWPSPPPSPSYSAVLEGETPFPSMLLHSRSLPASGVSSGLALFCVV